MERFRSRRHFVLAIIGFVIVAAGLALLMAFSDREGLFNTIPFLCVGVGSGIFGGNLGVALKYRALRKDPNAAKQIEIETKDERNRAIRLKAKAQVYDLMIYVFAALLLAFALFGVDPVIILTLVGVYLFFVFAQVYYISKYYKEM